MRLIAFHGFVISVLMVLYIPEESESCYVKTNGCSVPFGVPFPYKGIFRLACNKHDVCYSCGSLRRWRRLPCDLAFYRDMKELCKLQPRRKQKWCRKYAKIYYRAVRSFGWLHYEKCLPDWCKNACVVRRGSPYMALRG